MTALHRAALSGRFTVIAKLLEKGADIDADSPLGSAMVMLTRLLEEEGRAPESNGKAITYPAPLPGAVSLSGPIFASDNLV